MSRRGHVARTLAPVVALIFLAAVLTSFLTTRTMRSAARRAYAGALLARIAPIAEALDETDPSLHRELMHDLSRHGWSQDDRLQMIDTEGRILADSWPAGGVTSALLDDADMAQARRNGEGISYAHDAGSHRLRVTRSLARAGRMVGYLRATTRLDVVDRPVADSIQNVVVATLLSALSAAGLAFILVQRLGRPLEVLRRHAAEAAGGDHDLVMPSMPETELEDIAASLDTMNQELKSRIVTGAQGRKNLETILESMVEGLVAVDESQNVLLMNEVARRLLGVGEDVEGGCRLTEATRSVELIEGMRDVIGSGKPQMREIDRPNGSQRVAIEVHIAPLRVETNDPGGAVAVLHDVSPVRRLERVRRDFVANVSHELKTPLTTIQGAAETILDDPEMPPDIARNFVRRIADNSRRLTSLINDVLELSRIQSGDEHLNKVTIELGNLVREVAGVVSGQAAHKRISLDVEVCQDTVRITADRRALGSVVENLLSNAINYTPEGGRVRIVVDTDGRQAIIAVEDSGIGIASDQLDRIFERFYRVDPARSREHGGTGLGLAIVRNTVAAHGGDVVVDSIPGKGSSFRVLLPLTS